MQLVFRSRYGVTGRSKADSVSTSSSHLLFIVNVRSIAEICHQLGYKNAHVLDDSMQVVNPLRVFT